MSSSSASTVAWAHVDASCKHNHSDNKQSAQKFHSLGFFYFQVYSLFSYNSIKSAVTHLILTLVFLFSKNSSLENENQVYDALR